MFPQKNLARKGFKVRLVELSIVSVPGAGWPEWQRQSHQDLHPGGLWICGSTTTTAGSENGWRGIATETEKWTDKGKRDSGYIIHIVGMRGRSYSYTPRFNEVERGVPVYWYHFVRLSVCGQKRVRSVSSTILIGSISYLHILSSNFRRCVACNARFKIEIVEILANF